MSFEITVAAPFKHTRKDRLQKNDFIFYLALDRKWMSREQATWLIDRGVERGLLTFNDGWLTPHFDITAITIPLGYRPPPDIFQEEESYQALLRRIADTTGCPLTDITSEVNKVIHDRFDGHVRIEAAAAMVARKYRVPIDDLLPQLKGMLAKKK